MKHPGMFVSLRRSVMKQRPKEFLLSTLASLPVSHPSSIGSFGFIVGFPAAQAMEAGAWDCTGLGWGDHFIRGGGGKLPESWPHLKADIPSQLTFLALAQREPLQTREVPAVSQGGLV